MRLRQRHRGCAALCLAGDVTVAVPKFRASEPESMAQSRARSGFRVSGHPSQPSYILVSVLNLHMEIRSDYPS